MPRSRVTTAASTATRPAAKRSGSGEPAGPVRLISPSGSRVVVSPTAAAELTRRGFKPAD